MSYSQSYWPQAQVSPPGQPVMAPQMPGVAPMSGGGLSGMQPLGAQAIPLLSMYLQEQRMRGQKPADTGPGFFSRAGDWINEHILGGPSPGNSAAPVGAVQQTPLPPLAQSAPLLDPLAQSALMSTATYGALPIVGGT